MLNVKQFRSCIMVAIAVVGFVSCDARGQGLGDLQVTVDSKFLKLNDNFFERIGIDFDFTSTDPAGIVSIVSNDPDEPIDEDVDDFQGIFANQGTVLPELVEFGGRLDTDIADQNGRVPLSEVSVSGGIGITMPGGESGEMVA